MNRRALGRGLEALLSNDLVTDSRGEILQVRVDQILPNPYQPRKEFTPEKLSELVQSIKAHGILQPIIVRRLGVDSFELVAGERRVRAAREAGISTVPVIIREFERPQMLEVALIENLQREDINAVEAAMAYRQLRDEFGLSQEEIARKVGKSPASVSNMLRLLALPQPILQSISRGEITEGHGRALLQVRPEAQHVAWDNIRKRGLSVREAEKLGREFRLERAGESRNSSMAPTDRTKDPHDLAIEEALRTALGTKVILRRITHGVGKIEIDFYSEEVLEGLIRRLIGE